MSLPKIAACYQCAAWGKVRWIPCSYGLLAFCAKCLKMERAFAKERKAKGIKP